MRWRTPLYCLPVRETPSAPRISVFGAPYPACVYPCPTLRVQPHDCPRMARGQDGSLRLSCMTLSFTAPRRFIPTLSSPERICQTHLANQLPNFPIDRGPTRFALPTLPLPIPTEPSSMPGDHRFGLYDKQRRAPLRPEAGEPNPEQSVHGVQTKPAALRPLQDP